MSRVSRGGVEVQSAAEVTAGRGRRRRLGAGSPERREVVGVSGRKRIRNKPGGEKNVLFEMKTLS